MSQAHKPNLVLLSGLLCDDYVWQDIRAALADEFKLQVFSFAGFSSLEAMADHVLANAPERFALAGHSMGGRVALQVIHKAPERITHLGLLNTGVHPKRDSEVAGRQKLLDLADSEGMLAVANSWLMPMLGERAKQDSEIVEGLTKMITRHSAAEFHGQIQALLNRPDAEPFLASVNVPTLLLSSDEDAWSPIAQHAEMQKYISHNDLVEIEDCGHMSIVESSSDVAEAFRNWLSK